MMDIIIAHSVREYSLKASNLVAIAAVLILDRVKSIKRKWRRDDYITNLFQTITKHFQNQEWAIKRIAV